MVRPVFTTLLLASLVAIPASATRIDTVQLHAHASITKSSVHRAHRSTHPTSSHPTPRSLRSTATAKHRSSASRATAHPGASYSSARSHRLTPSTSHRATLKRTRYNRYRSGARFVPTAAVPLASSRSGTMNIPEPSARSTESLPTETDAERAPAPRSTPRPADSTPAANSASAETDTAPALGNDPATIAAAGNPLAAPRETRQQIAPASGQVAELNRPPIITGRVSSYTLRGTHDSLVRQNARSEEESLERIEDDADLQDRIARRLLVRVPESGALIVNAALPEDRRYCRPWTASFLTELSRAHQSQFRSPLVVSSAVRTVEYQKLLMRTNGNAADAEGDVVSPAFDRRNHRHRQIRPIPERNALDAQPASRLPECRRD